MPAGKLNIIVKGIETDKPIQVKIYNYDKAK